MAQPVNSPKCTISTIKASMYRTMPMLLGKGIGRECVVVIFFILKSDTNMYRYVKPIWLVYRNLKAHYSPHEPRSRLR